MCVSSAPAGTGTVGLLRDVPAVPAILFIIAHIGLPKAESDTSRFSQKKELRLVREAISDPICLIRPKIHITLSSHWNGWTYWL
jgi:hypothetical protein